MNNAKNMIESECCRADAVLVTAKQIASDPFPLIYHPRIGEQGVPGATSGQQYRVCVLCYGMTEAR